MIPRVCSNHKTAIHQRQVLKVVRGQAPVLNTLEGPIITPQKHKIVRSRRVVITVTLWVFQIRILVLCPLHPIGVQVLMEWDTIITLPTWWVPPQATFSKINKCYMVTLLPQTRAIIIHNRNSRCMSSHRCKDNRWLWENKDKIIKWWVAIWCLHKGTTICSSNLPTSSKTPTWMQPTNNNYLNSLCLNYKLMACLSTSRTSSRNMIPWDYRINNHF